VEGSSLIIDLGYSNKHLTFTTFRIKSQVGLGKKSNFVDPIIFFLIEFILLKI